MSNLIKDRIINLSNNELFEMIKNKRDYQASAIEFAIEELSNIGFKDKTARVLIEVEKINKKNFKQDYKDSLKESERRKSSSKFWSMFFIYIAVNILLIFITMQSNNPATKEAGMKGIIGGNMLLIIGWVFSLFSKKK